MDTDQQPSVAVIGVGTMGRGIARAFASAGFDTRVCDRDADALAAGMARLDSDLERSEARGRLTAEDRQATMDRIDTNTSLAEVVADVDLVVEAVPEDLDLKRRVFTDLERDAPDAAILATNTSALSVASIASAIGTPERVLGLHFFNPVHRMELVEVVVALDTDPDVTRRAVGLCEAIGKTTIEVVDRAGFATSRINAMIGNEAFQMLMEGVATAEDIDTAMRLALHHPMGPFELVDLVGLDVRLAVLRRLHDSLGERFRPSPLLVELVEAGRLGRKTGHGVFRYDDGGTRIS